MEDTNFMSWLFVKTTPQGELVTRDLPPHLRQVHENPELSFFLIKCSTG